MVSGIENKHLMTSEACVLLNQAESFAQLRSSGEFKTVWHKAQAALPADKLLTFALCQLAVEYDLPQTLDILIEAKKTYPELNEINKLLNQYCNSVNPIESADLPIRAKNPFRPQTPSYSLFFDTPSPELFCIQSTDPELRNAP